ncbi:MAG: tetratricopeptide repeat protein [bacterium]|nr:tetratricopeptide repeat protein [bacterium]
MTTSLRTAMALSALVLLTYANSLGGSFHYDDFHSLVGNPAVRELANIPAFFHDPRLFSVDADKSMYRSLLLVTYALQHAVHGYQASGFIAGNILIHLGCVLLLWRLVLRLAPTLSSATVPIAAALFAVHPVMGEPVNYVSSRSESLAALCILGALLLHVRTRQDRRWWGGSLALLLAGLLTKATAAALPLLIAAGELSGVVRGRQDWRSIGRRVAPYSVVLAGYVLWLSSRQLLPDDRAEPVRSLGTQLATQLKAVAWYVHLLSLPVHQSVDPAFTEGAWSTAVVWLGAALLVSVLLLLLRRASTQTRWWLLWPLLVALPASAVPLNVLVNEHRIYLAAAGLCVPFARLAKLPGTGWRRHWPALALVVLLATLSVQRNAVWASEKSLWSDAVAHGPHGARGRVHLGNALRQEGALAAAGQQFEQALRAEQNNLAAHTNLASIYYEQAVNNGGQREALLAAAEQHYQHVLRLHAEYREALTNLGNVYRLRGNDAEAAQYYQRAAAAHPEHPDAWANLADLAFELQAYGQASAALQRVVALEPTQAEGFRRLGDALARGGDLAGASDAYERACRLDPSALGACYNLAEVLRVRGDTAAAAGDTEPSRQLWTRALSAYRHVLQQAGDYRLARQQEAALNQRLAGVGSR